MRNVNDIVLFLFFAFLGIDTLILFMTWIVKTGSRRNWRIRERYLKAVEAVLRGEAYPRITSYNVCYTKLLRMAGYAALSRSYSHAAVGWLLVDLKRSRRAARCLVCLCWIVITGIIPIIV